MRIKNGWATGSRPLLFVFTFQNSDQRYILIVPEFVGSHELKTNIQTWDLEVSSKVRQNPLHTISLSPCVDRDIIGYIDTHTHIQTHTHTEEIFLRQRVRLDVRVV